MAAISQLGYLIIETADLAAWERFGAEVLGMTVSQRRPDGGFGLRLDSFAQRLILREGPAEDVVTIGFQVQDEANLQGLCSHLLEAGHEVVEGCSKARELRGVEALMQLKDPAGMPIELCLGQAKGEEPFESPVVRSGFVAEDLGLGHVVVRSFDQAASIKFYQELLGFRLSDRIACTYFGYDVDITFLHANPRHHTVAVGGPQRKNINHFMIEAASMDEVGMAFDRTLRAGHRIHQTLGRHPNDRMFSFYARTPSGFNFEFGWGGREVDDDTWTPTSYDQISEWGHHPPMVFAPRK